jgi:hypothetical protein
MELKSLILHLLMRYTSRAHDQPNRNSDKVVALKVGQKSGIAPSP